MAGHGIHSGTDRQEDRAPTSPDLFSVRLHQEVHHMVEDEYPAFTYFRVQDGDIHKTIEIGPLTMGWTDGHGNLLPDPHMMPDILVDVDSEGNVLGVEFLIPCRVEDFGEEEE